MNAGERLRAAIEEDRRERPPVWTVTFDTLVERIFCQDKEPATVMAALLSNRDVEFSCEYTDTDGVLCITCGRPIERIALTEGYMKPFMAIVRRNGLHGVYRKCGETREYEF
jgi:hypothetical protein